MGEAGAEGGEEAVLGGALGLGRGALREEVEAVAGGVGAGREAQLPAGLAGDPREGAQGGDPGAVEALDPGEVEPDAGGAPLADGRREALEGVGRALAVELALERDDALAVGDGDGEVR